MLDLKKNWEVRTEDFQKEDSKKDNIWTIYFNPQTGEWRKRHNAELSERL